MQHREHCNDFFSLWLIKFTKDRPGLLLSYSQFIAHFFPHIGFGPLAHVRLNSELRSYD